MIADFINIHRRAACSERFRGGALDNRGDAPMGKGHKNGGMPYDINTTCYLKPVYAAYDDAVRRSSRTEINLLAGVKTLKSFTLEVCAADHICNRSGDSGIFFGTEAVAGTVSTTRIMDDFMGYGRFRSKLATIPNEFGRGRHRVTKGAIKFPDKTFFLLPANISTLQQKNLGFAGMQDAFVTGKTGVIEEMIARTTQYEDAIVFLESQGGESDFDFDRHYQNTNQGELYVACPVCGVPHIFNWQAFDEKSMTRGADFMPRPPLSVSSLDHNAWIEHYRPLMLADGNRVAGFQRGPDEKIKNGEEYIEEAIIKETHFRCFHCDGIWLDDGEFGSTRIALDESSHYVSARPDALASKIGFNFPQWINRRLNINNQSGWGHMMLDKLKCQKQAEQQGNFEPIKIWWQKTAARTWNKEYAEKSQKWNVTPGTYETDPSKISFGDQFHCRQMTVDCGGDEDDNLKDHVVGTFWFIVKDWSKTGDSRQVAIGYVSSWELMAAQQRYWKVPAPRVLIDSAWMPSQIEAAAVKYFELVEVQAPGGQTKYMVPKAWHLLLGAGQNRRLSIGGKGVPSIQSSLPGAPRSARDKDGRIWRFNIKKITWQNLWFEQQLDGIIGGGINVKWEVLPRDKSVIVDVDGKPSAELTAKSLARMSEKNRDYSSQLNSRYYSSEKNCYADYDKHSRPTEFRDCELEQLVGIADDNIIGALK